MRSPGRRSGLRGDSEPGQAGAAGSFGGPRRSAARRGFQAAALYVTGQKAPLPNSHAQVLVDFGGWGLSVDVSGPAVTVDETAALAAYVTN